MTAFPKTVVAKKGISLADEVKVPNPLSLRPFRTFLEIEQPASSLVFRLRSGSNLPEVSLHEADGGQWKLEAKSLAYYLKRGRRGRHGFRGRLLVGAMKAVNVAIRTMDSSRRFSNLKRFIAEGTR